MIGHRNGYAISADARIYIRLNWSRLSAALAIAFSINDKSRQGSLWIVQT
jgi:hypothetical protein